MKHILFVLLLALVGGLGWSVGGELSPDAMGMAIGMLFGIMAGIPTALILLASQRRDDGHSEHQRPPRVKPVAPPQIVQNHYHYHAAPGRSRQAEVEQRHQLTVIE